MAVLCIAAVGIAGTTYESTLESDPDEIIDVEHSWLPIGKEPIQKFKDPQTSSSSSSGGGDGGGSGDEPAPCTGGLIGILANLFPALIPPCGVFYLLGLLIPLLLLLVLLGLTYRYRAHMAAVGLAISEWLRDRSGSDDDDGVTWPGETPANDVQEAWVAMVKETDIDRPWTRTPRECAQAAIENGLDSEAVETVTTAFEEVSYGDAPVTEERRATARDWLDHLPTRGDDTQ